MSFKRAREELAAWRQRLRLIECLGPGIERAWLADGPAAGFNFVALRTVDDFIAESEALGELPRPVCRPAAHRPHRRLLHPQGHAPRRLRGDRAARRGGDHADHRAAARGPQPAGAAGGVAGHLQLARQPAPRAALASAPCAQAAEAHRGPPASCGGPISRSWRGRATSRPSGARCSRPRVRRAGTRGARRRGSWLPRPAWQSSVPASCAPASPTPATARERPAAGGRPLSARANRIAVRYRATARPSRPSPRAHASRLSSRRAGPPQTNQAARAALSRRTNAMTQIRLCESCPRLAALALPLAGAALGQADAAELRYATSAPPKTVWEMQVQRFQKQVEDASKGEPQDQRLPQLAAGLRAGHRAAGRARAHRHRAAIPSPRARCWCPRSRCSTFPSCSRTRRSRTASLDNHLTKLTQDMFLKKGVVMLGWSEVGVADIIGKKPYISPDELKGLKARSAPSKVARLHVDPVRRQPQSAARDGMELGVPDRADRRRRTRRRRSISSPASPSSPRW